MSLNLKINLLALAIIAILVPTLSYLNLQRLVATLEHERLAKEELIEDGLESTATTLLRSLSDTARTAAAELSYSELQKGILGVHAADDNIRSISIRDAVGATLADTDATQIGRRATTPPPRLAAVAVSRSTVEEPLPSGGVRALPVFVAEAPFYLDGEDTEYGGIVRLVFSLDRVEKIRQESSELIRTQRKESLIATVGLAVLMAAIAIVLALFLSRKLTLPITELTRVAGTIARGDLEQQVRVSSNDEIEKLADSFEHMRLAIRRKLADLETIFEISKKLASTHELESMFTSAFAALQRQLEIRGGSLCVETQDSWESIWTTATTAESAAMCAALHAALDDVGRARRAIVAPVPQSCQPLLGHKILLLPLFPHGEHGVACLWDSSGKNFDEEEISFAETIGSTMSIAWSNIRMLDDVAQKTKLDLELKTAHAIQTALFQQEAPPCAGWDIAGYVRMATAVGGDWYGFLTQPDGSVVIVIGDVTGHGVPAALITAAMFNACRMIERDAREHNQPVAVSDVLSQLDEAVRSIGRDEYFMTMFALRLFQDGTVTYANAGHNFPLWAPNSRFTKWRQLAIRGQRLGGATRSSFDTRRVHIDVGGTIILYSDGIIECTDESGDEYGHKAFGASCWRAREQPASGLLSAVVAETDTFLAETPISDDITLIAVRRCSDNGPAVSPA